MQEEDIHVEAIHVDDVHLEDVHVEKGLEVKVSTRCVYRETSKT